MEDTLGLRDYDKKSSVTEWPLDDGDDLTTSPEISLSQQYLQVISKNDTSSEWPLIPATFMEQLSFYRAYTSTVSKIEILCQQQNNVKRFFWFYVFNVLCKSLPMTYIYLFLSSYSPDHPLFLHKMVPIFYGYNFIFLITGFFGLALMAYNTSLYIAYFLLGIIYNIPWNRCGDDINTEKSVEYICLNLDQFAQKVKGQNITYEEDLYMTADSEYFDLAQLEYFDRYITYYYKAVSFNKEGIHLIIFVSMWILAFCLRNHISKRYIWQILHRAQLLLCGLYTISFFHLILTYEDKKINYIEGHVIKNKIFMLADFDLLAESMTAPPVVHIISSRSLEEAFIKVLNCVTLITLINKFKVKINHKYLKVFIVTLVWVKPNLNSALIIISNSIFYIFRAMTSYLCKKYCENWVNASIIYWEYGSSSIFYMWPIYYSTIYTGDILVLVFFALNAIVDFSSFLIAFQCLIQTFICEWRWMKPWCIAIIIVLAAFLEYCTEHMFCESGYILWTCISTLSEIIVIFWMYPMGRFIDDITFHYGVPPTKLRLWSFTILPIFYFIKAYIILGVFLGYDLDFGTINARVWSFTLQLLLLLIGAVYSFYYYICKEKRNFLQLFKPAPEWGPKNFKTRQLRKQFDSRHYIGFQASRDLSGHLIENIEMTSYKVDIRYENHNRQPTFEAAKEHKA